MVRTRDWLISVLCSAPTDEGASGDGGFGAAPGANQIEGGLAAAAGVRPGDITIARDGTWWHEGRPIARKQLVRLFATVLRREDDGSYALVTPVERCRVHVEDAPFLAEEMEVREADGEPVLAFRTNVDQWVEAGPDHPLRVGKAPDSGTPRPYILVKPGLEARIVRSVFYRLADRARSASYGNSEVFGVWSRATFFPLEPTEVA